MAMRQLLVRHLDLLIAVTTYNMHFAQPHLLSSSFRLFLELARDQCLLRYRSLRQRQPSITPKLYTTSGKRERVLLLRFSASCFVCNENKIVLTCPIICLEIAAKIHHGQPPRAWSTVQLSFSLSFSQLAR
jgi:hypothetical protein